MLLQTPLMVASSIELTLSWETHDFFLPAPHQWWLSRDLGFEAVTGSLFERFHLQASGDVTECETGRFIFTTLFVKQLAQLCVTSAWNRSSDWPGLYGGRVLGGEAELYMFSL